MKRQTVRKALLLLSFLLFPVTLFYFSPYLILLGGFAGIATGSCLVFAALFLFSLLFGRAFCGWLCPAGGLQECCAAVSGKRVTGKIVNRVKYVLWVPWLIAVALSFAAAGGVRAVDFFYLTDHGISASGLGGYAVYYLIVLLILVLAFTVGRRGMCHSICWMAPFMVLGTKLSRRLGLPSLRLQSQPERCVECGACTQRCPMSLEVSKMAKAGRMAHSECILCGECADRCPRQAIHLSFGKPR